MKQEHITKLREILDILESGKELEYKRSSKWGESRLNAQDIEDYEYLHMKGILLNTYRAKPEPKRIPLTQDDLPFPMQVRYGDKYYTVHGTRSDIVDINDLGIFTFEELAKPDNDDVQYRSSHTEPWKPFYKIEE